MIPNVVKGADMGGLMRYLVGPGRDNEHEHPHVISGDAFLQVWHGSEDLDRKAAQQIAGYLDEPRRVFGTEMKARVREVDEATGEVRFEGWKDRHVWHCSLSLGSGEGPLSDEQWDAVAREFADRMGFTEASGKSPCRWVAVHHGTSKDGNDHIHVAASMVREDGTRWEGNQGDFRRAQEACRALEVKHGLARVEGRDRGTAERGEKPAERATATRAGLDETVPKELAHRVRAAAVASTSEAEWVRRVRADGLVVKPRFAAGSVDVVTGYKVAFKPEVTGGRWLFYGGARLGRDLSLERLREGWPAADVETAGAASAEWQAAFRGQQVRVVDGRDRRSMAAAAPDVAARNFAAFNARLADAAFGDKVAWADAARDVSGALSAWARYDSANAGELRRAASVLARSAQDRRAPLPPGRRVAASPMGTAFVLLSARRDDRPRIAGVVLLRQIIKTAEALRDWHTAAGDVRQAEALQRDAIARLQRVQLHGYAPMSLSEMTQDERAAWEAHVVASQGQMAPGAAPPKPPTPAALPGQAAGELDVEAPGSHAAVALPPKLEPHQDRARVGGARGEGSRDGSRG